MMERTGAEVARSRSQKRTTKTAIRINEKNTTSMMAMATLSRLELMLRYRVQFQETIAQVMRPTLRLTDGPGSARLFVGGGG